MNSTAPYVLIVKKEKTADEEEKLLFVGEVKVLRNRRFKLNKGMVEISGLRPSDSGNYICRIQVEPPIEVSCFYFIFFIVLIFIYKKKFPIVFLA